MSHGNIAKTKFTIYWNINLKSTLKTLSSSTSNREEKQKYIATYRCSIFILQGHDEHFKEL